MAANEQQKEQRELHEPAHHARRPMNAFLIFCKRHRGSVRLGFPHLENRAVTRVLGEWWATLTPDQKRSYTNLAQEYKDAFLNANPDFKWYKLPAPPLRTLNTRPTNKKCSFDGDLTKDDFLTLNYDNSERSHSDGIQPGKLADESQLGGLSSLFTPQKNQDFENSTIDETENADVPKPPKKRYTEQPLSTDTKRDCKADLFGDKSDGKESNNNHTNGEDDDDDNTYFEENSDENGFRGERTCKGLRYQKFLAEQIRNAGSSTQTKRRRISGFSNADDRTQERRNSISSNVSEKTDSLSSEGTSSRGDLEHLVESAEGNLEASKPEETETEGTESQEDYALWTSHKRFKAEDFNLEKKIEALPSLSLEEFQEKKKQQRTKKKKILQKMGAASANRKSQTDTSTTVLNRKAPRLGEEKALLVGSQKRKARKQSITRNTLTVDSTNLTEEQGPSKPWCSSPDLEALACLAAVAANRTKLTKS